MGLGSISLFLLLCSVSFSLAFYRTCESMTNSSCSICVANSSCLWCIKTTSCMLYPPNFLLPPNSLCSLSDARWGQCTVDFQNLIITLAFLVAATLIGFLLCVFWYCKCWNCGESRSRRRTQWQSEKRNTLQEQRRAELMARREEIRQKYDLPSQSRKGSTYSRFENA